MIDDAKPHKGDDPSGTDGIVREAFQDAEAEEFVIAEADALDSAWISADIHSTAWISADIHSTVEVEA